MSFEYQKISKYEGRKGEVRKVVLLYSGGLDTSVMLKWIQDEYQADVVALTIDIGQQADDLEAIREKALKLGAVEARIIDAKDQFAEEYIAFGIKANAGYQGDYHMSTPLGRPLLAKLAVEVATELDCDCIAHGCTGKGNDQVRIEGTILTLNPELKVIAPVREWNMGRDEELAYAIKHGIPVKQTADSPYSYDDNMWGVTGESGEIENPALIPPLEKILQVCTVPEKAEAKSELVELEFHKGLPVAVNGEAMKLADVIQRLNQIGARHGVGILHHIEDRVVGLKVRGLYEAPGAEIIIRAHRELEKYVCTRWENEFKRGIDEKFAYLCYGGLWYEPLMGHLHAYVDSVNEKVGGQVTLRLYRGSAEVVALETEQSLFDERLATFMKSDDFNQNAAPGFVELWTLQMKMAKQAVPQWLISVGPEADKQELGAYIKRLTERSPARIFATQKTHEYLLSLGVLNQHVYKVSEDLQPNIKSLMEQRRFDVVINIGGEDEQEMEDGKLIRNLAVKHGVQLITDTQVAKQFVEKLVGNGTPVRGNGVVEKVAEKPMKGLSIIAV